jgi:hypothetical protein
MTKEEYYAEERAYEAQIEAYCEQCRHEEDEWDAFEDEWQAHGFRDEADYNQWRYGSSRYL